MRLLASTLAGIGAICLLAFASPLVLFIVANVCFLLAIGVLGWATCATAGDADDAHEQARIELVRRADGRRGDVVVRPTGWES